MMDIFYAVALGWIQRILAQKRKTGYTNKIQGKAAQSPLKAEFTFPPMLRQTGGA